MACQNQYLRYTLVRPFDDIAFAAVKEYTQIAWQGTQRFF